MIIFEVYLELIFITAGIMLEAWYYHMMPRWHNAFCTIFTIWAEAVVAPAVLKPRPMSPDHYFFNC